MIFTDYVKERKDMLGLFKKRREKMKERREKEITQKYLLKKISDISENADCKEIINGTAIMRYFLDNDFIITISVSKHFHYRVDLKKSGEDAIVILGELELEVEDPKGNRICSISDYKRARFAIEMIRCLKASADINMVSQILDMSARLPRNFKFYEA